MLDAHIRELEHAYLSLLVALHASCGGKPTDEQLDAISYRGGAAIGAIALALHAAVRAREAQLN